MPLKTVRVRRSRPSAPALLLALMLTMLFVYAASQSANHSAEQTSAQAHMQKEIRMEPFTARFRVYAWTQDAFSARVEAANCAQSGGAGWIIPENGRYAVIFDVAQASEAQENAESILEKSAVGFGVQISGRADLVSAVADGARFLLAMATETGALASMPESGGDISGVRALMGIYKTQADEICAALQNADNDAAALICESVARTSARIDSAFSDIDASKIRLIHTAANAEWLALMEKLASTA